MFHPIQLASFALMHFEYFLDSLTDAEARRRLRKEDGTEMNAISWIVGHVSWQWTVHALAAAPGPDERLERLLADHQGFGNRGGRIDPTPPPLAEVRALLRRTREASRWVIDATDADFDREGREGFRHPSGQNQGSLLMRAVLHTWAHGGEINAIRQMMGHSEIPFVMFMMGNMDWLPAGSPPPAWSVYPPQMTADEVALFQQRNWPAPSGSTEPASA